MALPMGSSSPGTAGPQSTNLSECPWDSMLPGPPSRNNFGSIDLSSSGLLAFPSGSAVTVLDSRSVQLIATIPLPPPPQGAQPSSSPSLSSFVTSVRWIPLSFRSDLAAQPSSSHLLLAAGDRHGRIALLDFRLKSVILWIDPDPSPRTGVQDLSWILCRPDSYALAAITGPSIVSLFSTTDAGRCFFKYDASPEVLSCIRCDPFDSRRFCVIGLKGFLLSVKVLGETETDVVLKEMQIPTDSAELTRLERDAYSNGSTSSTAPASAVFPTYCVKFAFSPQWRHIIFVTFPKELVVFDLQYETTLFTASLPRGCARFMDVLPDSNNELLYCVHLDGKLSIWRRKKGEQFHIVCAIEELIPPIGTSVPSPSILAATLCQSESTLQYVAKSYSVKDGSPSANVDIDNPFDFCDDTLLLSKTHIISISDDGKVWNWILSAEGIGDSLKDDTVTQVFPVAREMTQYGLSVPVQQEHLGVKKGRQLSITAQPDVSCKLSLMGQLQLLSSTVTTLAVASPSLTATLARGGNYPAVAVPLVALGTQSGIIDVVDVSANAVTVSFSVHNGSVRGLRWLGNSRFVSFSYNQANDKTGGYVNKLVVTCVRTGLNKPFRVLQKPERSNIRALRTSSSGRYLLILLRDAPVEVWAMTKNPIMLRSLALPFTVLEWTLPSVPKPSHKVPKHHSSLAKEQMQDPEASSLKSSSSDPKVEAPNSDVLSDDSSESFVFALSNGALGVFEVHGRRIRDFRPKWPSSSFVSSDGFITAMAFRIPHVVMGDASGNIRWWDITTGHSSSFNTHREGIRRIKFSPYVPGDRSRGRIAILFNDNTFSVFDLDSPDPLANSLLQPQSPGTLVLELDWLPVRTDKNDPLVLCIAGADSSFRLIEVHIKNDKRLANGIQPRTVKERYRPMPICSPILLPAPHAMALRMILQLGVMPSWFNTCGTTIDKRPHSLPGTNSPTGDLRSYMVETPYIGDSVVPEMLLKVLEPYRKEGCVLDDEQARLYATVVKKGSAARFAFAAAIFGETAETLFWLQLPDALIHFMNKLVKKSVKPESATSLPHDNVAMLNNIESNTFEKSGTQTEAHLRRMIFLPEEIWASANEQISWHTNLEGEEAVQNRVHELVSIGNLDAAVSLLLSTSPDSSYFYPNALRAVALSSAVSRSLHELAVKVVAANMVRTDRSLSGIHLLCAVGRYQEACSQLQDAGCWTDAATLAASHLKGSDYARVLQRWADHLFRVEHNIWRALTLYVAIGAIQDVLTVLREAKQPDTAAMFILACSEFQTEYNANLEHLEDDDGYTKDCPANLPGLNPQSEDVIAAGEYYGQYQRKLVHLCMDAQPYSD